MIDLQIHTTATPHHATWEPEALVLAAKQAGLSVIAVTDHNTTASVRATQAAGEQHGVRVIPGVEIDSGFNGKLWHTLVYGVAPDDPALLALCRAVFERNAQDAARLRTELAAQGFTLPSFGEAWPDAQRCRRWRGAGPPQYPAGSRVWRGRRERGHALHPDPVAGWLQSRWHRRNYRRCGCQRRRGCFSASRPFQRHLRHSRHRQRHCGPWWRRESTASRCGIRRTAMSSANSTLPLYKSTACLSPAAPDSHGPHQPLAQWTEESCRAFLNQMLH